MTLLVQSISFIAVFVMLFAKKRSTAAVFLILGAAGGLAGSYMLILELIADAENFTRSFNDKDIDIEEDDIPSDEPEAPTAKRSIEIPVDETADETEFS